MASRRIKRETIDKNLYLLNGVVYVEKSRGRKIILKRKAPYQGSAAVNRDGKPTRKLIRWRDDMIYNAIQGNEENITRSRSESFPSIDEILGAYHEIAAKAYSIHRQPRPSTVKEYSFALMGICYKLGLNGSDSIAALDRKAIEEYISNQENKATAWSAVANAKSVFAKWTRGYYQDRGIKIPDLNWPKPKRNPRPKYNRPPIELRQNTINLFNRLEADEPSLWCALVLALNFAVSRVDAINMLFDHICKDTGMIRYTRQKTDGRTNETRDIVWPIDQDMLQRLKKASGHKFIIPNDTPTGRKKIIGRLNEELKKIGWDKYQKPYHEMRKLCVDGVYRNLGLEKAVQISGDNAETVIYYYSDPRMEDRRTFDVSQIL